MKIFSKLFTTKTITKNLNTKTHVLYLTRNGLLEPLGKSQVFNYLKGLSKDYRITLISYEKKKDFNNKKAMKSANSYCLNYGIRWLPQRFRYFPKNIAPGFSILKSIFIILSVMRQEKIHLIHARSYIPAYVALIIKKFTGIPFIFDMRALWPEELITAGRISRGSFIHKIIEKLERSCLTKSDGVVSLTNAAVEYLKSKYPNELDKKRLIVIPTCVDLELFSPDIKKNSTKLTHVCIGTLLSGWFRIEWLSKWMHTASKLDPNSSFQIITKDDEFKVRSKIDPTNQLADRLMINSLPTYKVPNALRANDISVMFFTDGLSKLGSAPTRLAESLSCGLPVIVNEGVGDVAEIVKKNKIGVIVGGSSNQHMENAFKNLQNLLKDPELQTRCYETAKKYFSLTTGTNLYRKIYFEILKEKNIKCAA